MGELPNRLSVRHHGWDDQISLQSIEQYTKQDLYQRLVEAQAETSRTLAEKQEMLDQLNHSLQDQADYIRTLEQRMMSQQADMNRSEANFKALIEHTSEMILSIDRDFRVVVINAQMRRFIKNCFQKDIRPGQLLTEDLPYDLKDRWIPHLQETFQARSSQAIESYIVSNKLRHLSLAFNPMLDSAGNVYAVSLFCEDITEQRETQEAIEQSQQLLESINKSIQEGIFRSSPQKGIIYVNEAFAKMFGYESIDEVLELDPYDLYVNQSRRDDFVRIMQNDTFFTNEKVHFKRKDGTTFVGLMSSVKVNYKGFTYHDGAIRDVTKLEKAEKELVDRNQELTKVNQELDSFVYRTSHDLRAPLASLLGLITISRLAKAPKERTQYFDLMEQSVNKLDGFIRDIIGYSRNSRMEVQMVPVSIEELINSTFRGLDYMKGSNEVHRILDIQQEEPLLSDPVRLEIIFNNLISNAIRYRNTRRKQPQLSIRVRTNNGLTTLEFADNGIGIETEYLEKIFEMFFRANHVCPGSGIGLYIVKEAVEKLGGSIRVSSKMGKGTTFTVELPQGSSLPST